MKQALKAVCTVLLLFVGSPVLGDENYDKLPPDSDGLAGHLNAELPNWIRLSGVLRTQLKGLTGDEQQIGNDYLYVVTRLRLNLDVRPTPWFRIFVQGEDARVMGLADDRVSPAFKDVMDLKQGYVELKAGEAGKSLNFRVGRQELFFGAQRLIGNAFWGNTGNTFDTAKFAGHWNGIGVDLFVASPTEIRMTQPDRPRRGQHLYGAYGSLTKLVSNTNIEPYLLRKTLTDTATNGRGGIDVQTLGLRWASVLPSGFGFSVEGARQTGNRFRDQIGAWAGYGNAGYTFNQVGSRPHVSTEYGYASGNNPRTGKNGTFDDLYPGRHGSLGIADLFAWRNLRHLRGSFGFEPRPGVEVLFDHNFLWLASRQDGLYRGNGSLWVASPSGGAASAAVGQEADIVVVYTPVPRITLAGGFAHLFPGEFLKENSPGGAKSFAYLSVTYRF